MKLSLDNNSSLSIQSYSQDGIIIRGITYQQHLIITPRTVINDWAPPALKIFTLETLKPGLSDDLEVFILGTGNHFLFPPMTLAAQLSQARIGFEAMDTGAACRTYNILLAEGRIVAAGLLID